MSTLVIILFLLALVCGGTKKEQNKELDWVDRLEELNAIIEDE